MTDFRNFSDWFDNLGVRHFDADEFTDYFARVRDGVKNSTPPREMWGNIVQTIRIVDDLRAHLKRPVVLLSSYRSPAYNRAVGGARASQHLRFNALDIAVSGRSPEAVFSVLEQWRDAGKFRGGLGLYPTFVHIDTRGSNATW